MDNGFSPKVHRLRQLTRPDQSEQELRKIEDVTVRNYAAAVLESENFTNQLYRKQMDYLIAIDEAAARILEEG